ncbi:unnamed protein product [Urochloa humidicola]
MEKMVHLAAPHASSIDGFVLPARPATAAAAVSLPVIDMSLARDEVRRAILDAGKEYGFFQVVNHGIPEQVMWDMEAVCHEFFQLPAAEKAEFYSEDKTKPNRLFSGSVFETLGEKYWRDCLRLIYPLPSGDTSGWPNKPQKLREVGANYALLARGLAMEILRLLCEGTGLRPDYFEGEISGHRVPLDINHYPPCPDPSKTLGLPPHCDRELITVLLPGSVPGLEVAYKGDWIRVEPVQSALIINFGLQLEVVTNGALRGVQHRAVTNSAAPRTSVATFVVPPEDCVVGPAVELVSKDNPPRYRTVTFAEFKRIYNVINLGSSLNQTFNLNSNNDKEM